MLVHKPSPSLDKFVIDICSKSLQIALKVHWFLMAELEDSDDNEGISRIQEKCQIAATLIGEWTPLVRPPSSLGKNQVLNKLLSSKQRLLSLTSPPAQRSFSFSPPSVNSLQEDGSKASADESKIFKKFIPGPKVRDALLFRKSVEKGDEEPDKDGFFKRLLRDSRDDDSRKSADKDEDETEKDGFFRRLLRDSRDYDEEVTSSSEGFFKRLFRDGKVVDSDEKILSKSFEEDEKDGFFRKFFKDRSEDRKDGVVTDKNEAEEKYMKFALDDEKDGFFKKLFREKADEKKDGIDRTNDEAKGQENGEDEDTSEFSLFRRIFRVHTEDSKTAAANENGTSGSFLESSPGTEKFFRKLFKDRDRSVEDSELFGSKKNKENLLGSPKPWNEKSKAKPPLPNSAESQYRKGTYHESLDFVHSLCETSYGLVDVFPVEDRKSALRESLAEINTHVVSAQCSGGVCFPMGKGMYRVVHIPEEEAVLLNSREKAPYLICVEVLKSENQSDTKDSSNNTQKHSKGGIPLANGDALLNMPPPWAYPLWTGPDMYRSGYDRMSRSTSEAIDQAMAQLSKMKFVHVNLSLTDKSSSYSNSISNCGAQSSEDYSCECGKDDGGLGWVRVLLTADPGVRMDDVEDQEPSRRKEHRRVPSTVLFEEVKAAALKGEAPPGLPLKGAGHDLSDSQPKVANGGIPKASDALSGELWEIKRDRIRKASVYGKLPGWDLRSIIVKSGDDCRQEHLAVQLISHFYDIFQEAGLPLWLRPYEVLVTSSYTALIETIPDTASIHSIKSRFPNIKSLRDFFIAKYQEDSPNFKLAQRNFVESMAGYSLVCYLLQVKDRHNGNLLLDEEGHVIHIDFGFMLSNSPGGVNFESAPFKLTRELLEVMDSDAEGVPSEFFDYFKVLCIQGFLTCRKHAERIILLVEMLQDSGFPCFKGGSRTIQNLRKRFHLSLTEEQCVSLVLSLISSSLDAWRTRQYDYYQRVLNGIL
jgi:phosphatidylinositol 4-kinase